MSIFTDTPHSDRVFEIASFVDDFLQSAELNEELADAFGDANDSAVLTVLLNNLPMILESDNEGVDATLTSLASVIAGYGAEYALQFAEAVKQSTNMTWAEERLKSLSFLFNTFPSDSQIRYSLFSSMVETAAASHTLDAMLDFLSGDLSPWLSAWGASVEQTRALYKQIYSALESAHHLALANTYLKKLLVTYQGATKEEMTAAVEDANLYIAASLNSEGVDLFPVLSLDVIASMSGTPVHSLLTAVVNGDKAAFAVTPDSVFEALKVDKAAVERKVTINALVAALGGAASISFADLSAGSGIAVEDLEAWLIDAMCVGALEASIDEVNQIVTVKRVLSSTFDANDWQLIEIGLKKWKEGLASVVSTLNEVKLAAEGN